MKVVTALTQGGAWDPGLGNCRQRRESSLLCTTGSPSGLLLLLRTLTKAAGARCPPHENYGLRSRGMRPSFAPLVTSVGSPGCWEKGPCF